MDTEAARRHLRRSDPVMRRIITTVGECRLRPGSRGDHFTTLARSIVGQQVSTASAASTWKRLVDALGGGKVRPEDILAAKTAKLRAAGLSGAKVDYLRALSERVVSGDLKIRSLGRYDDQRIIDELTATRGIGVWTAEMFLIFRLGRPDVWPVGDLGIRNAVEQAYRIEATPDALRAVAEPWRPWRSVASWYLWRSLKPEII